VRRDHLTQRKKQVKLQVKQMKHTKIKNEGENICQIVLNKYASVIQVQTVQKIYKFIKGWQERI